LELVANESEAHRGDTENAIPAAGGTTGPARPGSFRWTITFGIIALLVVAFGAIAVWGLTHSDWLYGTYGQISSAQWDQIAGLHEQLQQLNVAPGAVVNLDDALLLPRPSTEQVLNDLRQAVLALDPYADDPTALAIQRQIRGLVGQIKPGYAGWSPTPAYHRPVPPWEIDADPPNILNDP
jgi:hypothetical protein